MVASICHIGCFILPFVALGWRLPWLKNLSDPSQERLNGKGHGRSAEEVSSGESASAQRKRGLEQQRGGGTIPIAMESFVGEIYMEV